MGLDKIDRWEAERIAEEAANRVQRTLRDDIRRLNVNLNSTSERCEALERRCEILEQENRELNEKFQTSRQSNYIDLEK